LLKPAQSKKSGRLIALFANRTTGALSVVNLHFSVNLFQDKTYT